MMEMLASKERTIPEVQEIMQKSGWKLVQIHQGDGTGFSNQKAVGVPI